MAQSGPCPAAKGSKPTDSRSFKPVKRISVGGCTVVGGAIGEGEWPRGGAMQLAGARGLVVGRPPGLLVGSAIPVEKQGRIWVSQATGSENSNSAWLGRSKRLGPWKLA